MTTLNSTTGNVTTLNSTTGNIATLNSATITNAGAASTNSLAVGIGGMTVAAGAPVSMGSNRVQNVATPIDASDAANKAYVDAMSGNVANLQGAIDAQTARINSAFREIDKNTEGIAIALAMGGIALPQGKDFALSANFGILRHQASVRGADGDPPQRRPHVQRRRRSRHGHKSDRRPRRRDGGVVTRRMIGRTLKLLVVACHCYGALPLSVAAAEERVRLSVPTPDVLLMLVRTTLVALNQANFTGNYSVLHDLGTPHLQATNSQAQLGIAFTNLREQKLDLSRVLLLSPDLTEPPSITATARCGWQASFQRARCR